MILLVQMLLSICVAGLIQLAIIYFKPKAIVEVILLVLTAAIIFAEAALFLEWFYRDYIGFAFNLLIQFFVAGATIVVIRVRNSRGQKSR